MVYVTVRNPISFAAIKTVTFESVEMACEYVDFICRMYAYDFYVNDIKARKTIPAALAKAA